MENRRGGERCSNIWNITTGSATIRAKTIGSRFLRGQRQGETWEQCGVENDWGACGSTTKGKRHKSGRDSGRWDSRSAHILRIPGISLAKALPGPIYHQRAQSNDFWLRAATRTSFFTIRDKGSKEMDEKNHEMAHRRMVARRGILKNRGRNNNSPATGLADPRPLLFRQMRLIRGQSKDL